MLAHDVEQRSDAWYALRLGKPTASEFSSLITAKGNLSKAAAETYAITLAGEKYAGARLDAFDGNYWTERGRQLEEDGLRLYSFMTDLDIHPVGFVTDDDNRYGCSPDALVGDDGLVEVKSLKAENHVKAILHHQEHGTCPPDYKQQTQGQLLVCERAWCDLVFYHPELPLLVVRETPDPETVKLLDTALSTVLKRRDEVLAALRLQDGEREAA